MHVTVDIHKYKYHRNKSVALKMREFQTDHDYASCLFLILRHEGK